MRATEYIKDLKKRVGSPYVYGVKQNKEHNKVTSRAEIINLQKIYGKGYVWDSDVNKAGGTCCDCSGFVDYQFQKGYNSTMLNLKADNVVSIRKKNGSLDASKLKSVPLGAVLWQKGHVGVFIGYNGSTAYYIAQDGSRANCRIAKVKDSGFTHALYNIEGYDIKYYIPRKFKTTRKTNAYTTNNAKVKLKTFKKGVKINAVARVNNYVLCRKYGYNMNCWVSIRDLVELK